MMKNFAPALIMFRVVPGRARPDTEWSAKLSGLHFACEPAGELGASSSGHCRGLTSTIITMPRIRDEVLQDPNLEEAQENPNISEFSRNGSEFEIEEKI